MNYTGRLIYRGDAEQFVCCGGNLCADQFDVVALVKLYVYAFLLKILLHIGRVWAFPSLLRRY